MAPDVPSTQVAPRRSGAPLFVPVLLAALALAVVVATLVATLSMSGVRVPGRRTLQAVLDRVPQPWKPPRPAYVLPPETTGEPAHVPELSAPARSATGGTPGGDAPSESRPPAAAAAAAAPGPAAPPTSFAPAPPAWRLEGFRHEWQTWNNCGPATIAMATSYFGRPESQAQAAPWLKPNPNDKNVGPDELVAYARSLGLQADWRAGGDLDRLKLLLANSVPVITSIWITPKPNDGLGHYRLLVGYDDAAGRFTAYDSFVPPGINLTVPYGQLDDEWRVYNRTYVAVYRPEQAGVVAAILGSDRDDQTMFARALAAAQAEAAARPTDAFAWFNVGTNLVALGRTAEAVPAFDRARALRLPWRMLWYQLGPFEAYLAEGRLSDVLSLTAANLAQTGDLEESHYYRGRALQAQGEVAAARAAYQAALRANPRFAPASHALSTLG
jgi:tetratricopeptide (TPR) repeat protein